MGKSSEILRKAREAGSIGGGQERAKIIKPLMDDIADHPYEWASDQCARFFEALLRKYVERDYLEQLLADSGIGAEYENIKTISKRHDYLIAKYPEKYRFDKTTLRKRGTGQIDRIAGILDQDSESGYIQAKQLLASVLTDAEFEQLRRAGVVLPAVSEKSTVNLKRIERISNIGASDGQFVGRTDLLQALENGFKEGHKVQLIGGADGWGKSRVALEYAQRHVTEYQIICWINAQSEDCIQSSIVSFFNLAKVSYKNALPDGLSDLFCRFFEANTDWLLVFDNPDLKLSLQREILKKYLPSGEGHVIITGNFDETSSIKGGKYHLLDKLDEKQEDSSLAELSALCCGQPVPLTLATSYIRESEWVDAAIYLHMLRDRGISAEKDSASCDMGGAEFEIKMGAVRIKKEYFLDIFSKAVEQFLLISAICNQSDLDLSYMSTIFPIFPDPLGGICASKDQRIQLVEQLKGFGFYELREGVLHGNNWLCALSRCYFGLTGLNNMCSLILGRMEKCITAIRENQYAENSDTLLILAKPLARQVASHMVQFGGMTFDMLSDKYPNVRSIM